MVKKKENLIVVENLLVVNVETMAVALGVGTDDYINIRKMRRSGSNESMEEKSGRYLP